MNQRSTARVLTVEAGHSLCERLRGEQIHAEAASSLPECLEKLTHGHFDVVLIGVAPPPGLDAGELARRLHSWPCPPEVLLLLAPGQRPLGVEAIGLGAAGYLLEPAQDEELAAAILSAVDLRILRREHLVLQTQMRQNVREYEPVAEDLGTRELLARLRALAPSASPVLITGERGTGKKRVGRLLCRWSPAAPVITFHCEEVPQELHEEELRGSEAHPGLLELAHGGALILHEVLALSPAAQPLIHTLLEAPAGAEGAQAPSLPPRIVATSSGPLQDALADSRFHEALGQRLLATAVRVPSLRDRRADVPALATRFLQTLRGAVRGLDAAATRALLDYDWPGNERELELVLERACLRASGELLGEADLAPDLGDDGWRWTAARQGLSLAQLEREYICAVLDSKGGHRGRTARALGIDPKTLYNKLGPQRSRKRQEST